MSDYDAMKVTAFLDYKVKANKGSNINLLEQKNL